MAKTLETSIQKRFSDVDPFQHVNNVSQQMYFDVGKMEYYEQVLGDEVLLGDMRIITVSTSTSYLGQIRLQDRVRVSTTRTGAAPPLREAAQEPTTAWR
mgnify:CR=1 FL=1